MPCASSRPGKRVGHQVRRIRLVFEQVLLPLEPMVAAQVGVHRHDRVVDVEHQQHVLGAVLFDVRDRRPRRRRRNPCVERSSEPRPRAPAAQRRARQEHTRRPRHAGRLSKVEVVSSDAESVVGRIAAAVVYRSSIIAGAANCHQPRAVERQKQPQFSADFSHSPA